MRNVLKSSNEVYHYFANKSQPSGRAGNTSFALPRAYSYAAVIGKHIAPGIVALSSNSGSVTTTSHQSDLRRACSHLECLHVPDPDDLETSYRAVQINVTRLLKQASTARTRRDSLLGDALHQVAQFNRFAELSGSPLRIDPPVTDTAALTAIAVQVKADKAAVLALHKQRDRINSLDDAAKLAEWRAGGNVRLHYGQPVALRVKGELIETSKGASIPLDQAPSIWAMVNRKKGWAPRDPIGAYQLTQIKENGDIVVGCHHIAFTELALIAKQLGYVS